LAIATTAIATATLVSRAVQRDSELPESIKIFQPVGKESSQQPVFVSGIAEPGSPVKIYREIGTAVAGDAGRFEYSWSGESREGGEVLAIVEGKERRIANVRVSSGPVSMNSPSLDSSRVTYKSISTRGDIQELSIAGLDQVCPLYSTRGNEEVKSVEYWGVFQNRNVSGSMTFANCGSPLKDEFIGTFEEQNGCSGEVKLITMPDERDKQGIIERAMVVWQPISCEQAEEKVIAVVQR
jgi:hypothetical protein